MSLVHGLAARALRALDPETAHRVTMAALRIGLGPRHRGGSDPILATGFGPLLLDNPIGVAAGFDKSAEAPDALLRMGFGFVECGTTTPRAQTGNPRPRLFRLPADRAVINRLGFNNDGVEAFARRLAARVRRGVVGANIGANKDSADRISDYVSGLTRLWLLADYFTLNISSPNTPGLRELQEAGALADLLGAVAERREALGRAGADRPLFLKIAPDLGEAGVEAIVEAAVRFGLSGLIVGNTTLARPDELTGRHRFESGGLSGAPLMGPSTRLLRHARQCAGGRLILIGVGGVGSGADAYAKIRAGANAIQLYTALTFSGPGLLGSIKRDLAARLRADGFTSLAAAVGAT